MVIAMVFMSGTLVKQRDRETSEKESFLKKVNKVMQISGFNS